MKIADLYVRVSTDEQADKGYSLRSQQEVLNKYCELNKISVRRVFVEDHSAKTFNRPEWKRLIIFLKKNKGKSDLLLFTKWDRFSRNTSDAYQTISALNKMGIDPQAIEQPLDLTVPENKMMLAVYLTTPEIENDRRGLNTKAGIRQAKKEGRWTGKAPLGYINRTHETGRKYIATIEPQASLMKWVFKELERGNFSGENILNAAREKGLECSKNNFYTCIRNPMYCGRIVVPKYKDEPERTVQGQHEALITETQFYNVQQILDSRKRETGVAITTPSEIVLRGFLLCPNCDRSLTASSSRGKNGYYTYYHCTSNCGARFRAEKVNADFETELLKYLPREGVAELFIKTVTDQYKSQTFSIIDDRKDYIKQIEDLNKKIDRGRGLLLDGDIEGGDFQVIKSDCNKRIEILEARLNDLNVENAAVLDMEGLLQKAMRNIEKLDLFYDKSSVEGKRYLISFLFQQKLTYENGTYRTPLMNEIAQHIYLKNKELGDKKKGQKIVKNLLPHKGCFMIQFSTALGYSVKRCAIIHEKIEEYNGYAKDYIPPF